MRLYTLCYIRKDGKTLMIHRVKKQGDVFEGKWNWLWGKFEEGESPQECAIRELKEETGLRVENPKLRGIITFPGFYKDETAHVYLFEITQFSWELIDCKEWNLEWIDDDKILDLNLWEWDRIFLPWMKQDKIFCAKITYDNGKVVDHSVDFF